MTAHQPLLEVKDLVIEYGHGEHAFRAVDGVSFSVDRGETLAVVGESGCGKSTIAKALVRLLKPTAGQILLDGTDLAPMSQGQLRPLRSKIQMVFQDPYGSLDPHMTAQEIVAEPVALRGTRSKSEQRKVAAALIDRVGLPATALERKPPEFSGGQRQRIGIARALASNPELLVCDEATSALDVSVQAQVLELLSELQAETGLTYVFITHNLGVVRAISKRTLVMRSGRIVEQGYTEELLARPREEYTRRLRRSALEPSMMSGIKPRDLVRAIAASRTAEKESV
ncbi:ATP-binding cassette domain-containing protein [Arsenicicoccus piscis]|uniref:ABC transporter ATP-binding protein n=1 Tax=Arsenicicoccus piscis TaxID=673954 RepID=A0ABQ6HMD1_9MICO|nr:dipeptide/oligopeptide/nickel ABC transporter ATP-binding protein [Arsenicicoccus piscis]GMA18869.1 ABC transporter ATP-binding protein [Arsenicicoccus piscis]